MPRNTDIKKPGFIWLPREKDIVSSVYIKGVQVTDFFYAEFSRAIFPEIGTFKIELINADGSLSDKYTQGDQIEFYLNLDGETATRRFLGKTESVVNQFDGSRGFVLTLSGGHISSNDMLNLYVTASYNGTKTCDEILKEMIDEYLTGYTYNNVGTSTEKPVINWERKPFRDCVEDLCKVAKNGARFDAYVDDDKDFHFFEEKSIHNSDEAIVWNDTLLETNGLGTKSLETKNYVQVVGDDGSGLPVLTTTQDEVSQSLYGLKESYVVDNAVSTLSHALNLANANLALNKTPEVEGTARALILPSLQPGHTIYISDPTMGILDKYKIAKYTQKLPSQETDCVIYKRKTIAGLFQDRVRKELALEKVTNPYRMIYSANLTFDDYSELAAYDSNVEIVDGKIQLSSGAEGTVTSNTFSQPEDISQIHLLVVGEQYDNCLFKVSTDGGTNSQTVSVNELINLDTPGDGIVIQIKLVGDTAKIDSVACLLKP